MSIHDTAKKIQNQLARVIEVNHKLEQLLNNIDKQKKANKTKNKVKAQ